MIEENKKEILTKEKIKAELSDVYRHNILLRIELCLVLALWPLLMLILVKFPTNDISNIISTIITLIAYCMLLVLLIYAAWCTIVFLRLISTINTNQFEIFTDKLVNKEDSKHYKHYHTRYGNDQVQYQPNHRKPFVCATAFENWQFFVLYFQNHKKFLIPVGKLYRWSDKYRMEDWAVYRWAEIGDEFYVVTVKNKPLYVYNTKHFELKD